MVGPSSSSVRDDEGGQQVAQATPRGGGGKAVREGPPATLPRFEALSPENPGFSGDAKLKVRLARLQRAECVQSRL